MRSIWRLTILFVVVLIIASCNIIDVPTVVEVSPTALLAQTAIIRSLPTPSPSQITLTPRPTLTENEAKRLVRELLEDNAGCRLPCWWGITPGKTTWAEARHFLEGFALYIHEGEIGAGVQIPLPAPYSDAQYMDHEYSVKNGIVDSISIFNFNLAPNYYLPKFLETYGEPSEIWIRTDRQSEMGLHPFLVDLFYQDKGILIEYSTGHPLNEVGGKLQNCRLTEMDSPFIYLWSPEEQISFDEAKRKFLDTRWLPEPKPLLAATGMDIKTFYETFKNPSTDACLETPKNLWP
jgi:uncharacterized cupin superfamily protein